MILNNFKVLNLIKQSMSEGISFDTVLPWLCKDTNGDIIESFYWYYRYNTTTDIEHLQYSKIPTVAYPNYSQKVGTNGVHLVIGSGNTPVTENDYQIENEITAGIKLTVDPTASCRLENDGIAWDYVYYFKNTSNDTLTIKEVGLVGGLSYYKGYRDTPYKPVLITREVLEEPIVVPAGGYFTIQTGLKFSI